MDHILIVGINHMSASINFRERAAVSSSELPSLIRHLKSLGSLDEIVILSTCSRLEIIAVSRDPAIAVKVIRDWFHHRVEGIPEQFLYSKTDIEAVSHIFRVTAGLDSWILGESEILGQVKDAYQLAARTGGTCRILNRVFQKAISAGKQARSETGIQNGIRSIGGAAALLAGRIFGTLSDSRILVFGAGQAAEAVVRHLAAKGFSQVSVASRNLERAKVLADTYGGPSLTLEQAKRSLEEAEIAIFSLSVTEPVLLEKDLKAILAKRSKSIFIIDLGLPRNVDSLCGRLAKAFLYDLEDLKAIVQESMDRKADQKSEAESLVDMAVRECVKELNNSSARQAGLVSVGGGVR